MEVFCFSVTQKTSPAKTQPLHLVNPLLKTPAQEADHFTVVDGNEEEKEVEDEDLPDAPLNGKLDEELDRILNEEPTRSSVTMYNINPAFQYF